MVLYQILDKMLLLKLAMCANNAGLDATSQWSTQMRTTTIKIDFWSNIFENNSYYWK